MNWEMFSHEIWDVLDEINEICMNIKFYVGKKELEFQMTDQIAHLHIHYGWLCSRPIKKDTIK